MTTMPALAAVPGRAGPDSAERASLRALLSPASVAVVGAMQRHGGAGYEMVRALRDYGYRGRLYPVNGSGRLVHGIPGHRTIADLPRPVDLLVIAVPADQVPPVLREAGHCGVRSAVVLTGAATGSPDRPPGSRLRRIAAEHGMHLIGPDSLGVINTDPRIRLNASLSPTSPQSGGLAVVTRSGAVGIAVLEHAARSGCGLAAFVSLGDQPAIGGADLIAHWHADPHVRAVALDPDSFGDPVTFARIARLFARSKPLLAIRDTRATPGQDVLFEQAGIVRTDNLDHLMDAARILVDQPLPAGRRLGIVGNAGGLTELAAELAEANGFILPRLDGSASRTPGRGNPVDTGADATPRQVADAVETLAHSREVDLVLALIVGTRANVPDAVMTAVADVLDKHPRLTTAAVLAGSADDIHHLGTRRMPVYRHPERVIRALAHACRYATWRRQRRGGWVTPAGLHRDLADTLIARARQERRGWLPSAVTVKILATYGIAVLPASHPYSAVGAVAAAERLGYPVVVRTVGREARTRNAADHLRLGLTCATEVHDAFEALTRPGDPAREVLLQRQVSAPVRLAAGITKDPHFGSVLHLRRNRRRAAHILPLTDLDAGRMVHEVLDTPPSPIDTAGLVDLLQRLSCLAEDHPEIARLDLNPLFAGPDVVVADARLRLAERHSLDEAATSK
ncbi:acetate--CoA ligase family protein [Actinoplanes sp. KI2]|uniref:acetate--CoA ligase family protein n=1 Tax=Actinoplanes sp. KI2 TaxID=2983315 RepID=UPI0021D58148|nr:acetate--CoA ligase family protein [Actinoplanes sp. KI2]MCU7729439.1 acetate--CoA ligase family protein [Actinoplanes sp. KI2]